MLDHPTTFTVEGVRRAMEFREINTDGHYITMLLITLVIYAAICVAISVPLYRRNKAVSLLFSAVTVLSVIPVISRYFRISRLALPECITNARELFNVLDGVVIMLAHCYGISYETANLVMFALVQPLIIIILFIFSITGFQKSQTQAAK